MDGPHIRSAQHAEAGDADAVFRLGEHKLSAGRLGGELAGRQMRSSLVSTLINSAFL